MFFTVKEDNARVRFSDSRPAGRGQLPLNPLELQAKRMNTHQINNDKNSGHSEKRLDDFF
jgi:hypothetical protein